MLVRVDTYGTRVFRDVIAVDGKPVRSRDERLKQLFLGPSRKALDQARAIRKESTRYDIDSRFLELAGALTLPLVIVKPRASVRFRFEPTSEGVAFNEVDVADDVAVAAGVRRSSRHAHRRTHAHRRGDGRAAFGQPRGRER